MSTWTILDRMFQSGIRTPTVLIANQAIALRGRDSRHFSIDADGAWVNRQARATFVSPTIHSARYESVSESVLNSWCHTYMPKSGDIVFDVGAGIGDEAVIFSHLVEAGGRVYSIEAHPGTFACLKKTADRSHLQNVTLLPCAITNDDGSISISSGSHLSNSVLKSGDIAVVARSVASLCEELGLSRIDFLKMNIEGAERLAVLGFGNVQIPHIAIACHDFIADAGGSDIFRTKSEVKELLAASGYRITERPGHKSPWVRDTIYADKAS
jgi:FkbM family methyltransferase